jgi:hypothetical protein
MSTNKDYSKLKFSELIIELSEMWSIWMKSNFISHDLNVSIELRRKSVERCESLRDEIYIVVEHLDNFFKK